MKFLPTMGTNVEREGKMDRFGRRGVLALIATAGATAAVIGVRNPPKEEVERLSADLATAAAQAYGGHWCVHIDRHAGVVAVNRLV